MTVQPSPDFVSKQVIQSRYSFINLTPSKSDPLSLVCAGQELCNPNFHLKRTSFHYFAIELIISGKWELNVAQSYYELGPGSLFAYSPTTSFTLRSCSQESPVKYFMNFAGSEAQKLLTRANLTPGLPILVLSQDGIRSLLDHILDSSRYPLASAKEMGALLTRLLLLRIAQDGRPHSNLGNKSHATYRRCRDLIQQQFRTLSSVNEISELCHIDRAYLSRLFKLHAGESPYQLLIRLKMEYAAERLRNHRKPIKSLAAEVGYDDPFHFSRVFKRRFGLSPKLYASGNTR
ncbi:MAG: AraC family transcriptional regulator [Verrucomicrobiota bacterium]